MGDASGGVKNAKKKGMETDLRTTRPGIGDSFKKAADRRLQRGANRGGMGKNGWLKKERGEKSTAPKENTER